LINKGARIILACRDMKKAEEAAIKIREESKNENIEVEHLDLSSLKSTKDFANRMISKLDKLDILINNAGLSGLPFLKTEDGFEMHFAVNYLGPYYLTRLLLDLLKKSAPSRIINVSSAAHKSIYKYKKIIKSF
jgi:retinol dehydrogenase-12